MSSSSMYLRNQGVYLPIGDYAIIGDGHTAALVARDGSIDWCCWPRFDSAAVFCRLLDAQRGGWFQVCPAAPHRASREYIGNTNVLATTFTTDSGRVRLVDFMPVGERVPAPEGQSRRHDGRLLRLVEGVSGQVDVDMGFRATFDYARGNTELTPVPGGAVARSGSERLYLSCPVNLRLDEAGAARGITTVRAGDRTWLGLTYRDDGLSAAFDPLDHQRAEADLSASLEYWRRQEALCTYDGPYHPLVRRSTLALKLLTYQPTGAIVAAPTTSLPEQVGGVRNWDYRYTWLRDSGLILFALQSIGYHHEASEFFAWLQRLSLERHDRVQIMYALDGTECVPEQTLDHLHGYRGSRPVRIGNGAAGQVQLDIYGAVLDAAHVHLDAMHEPTDPRLLDVLRLLADRAALRWKEPDNGIWEVRGEPRHFLYSKLLCWVALDRAVRLADREGLSGDRENWRRTRDTIREAIVGHGYDHRLDAFTRAFDEPVLDASALAIPLVGFLPATDPRVLSTVQRIQEQLTAGGLVYRYRAEDGLPGGEGAFALCSFWLVDNLALAGRVDEARELFEKVVGYANDVGLMSEEIDPDTGELLGNFPQGFTHLALITSAVNIAEAEAHGAQTRPETRAERQSRAQGAASREG